MSLLLSILDDDESILATFQAMAKRQHWTVLASTNFEDARKWFADGQIDLLLLDYHMPRINGMNALKILKSINADIPILMLTVEQNSALASDLLMEGAADFISKPVRLADFVARIRLHEKLADRREGGGWRYSEKGMTAETRRRIVDGLQTMRHPATIKEVAAVTGFAYPTVHRYLDYLYQQKTLNRTENTEGGKGGRPVVRYSLLGLEE
jgi:two-component system response regulator DctR